MKTIIRLMLVSVMLIVAAPAYSATAMHIFFCEEDDETSEEDVLVMASKWLKAARASKGGANLEAHVLFPIAAAPPGGTDLMFLVTAPSFEEWGVFWDGYDDSEAADIDEQNREHVVCPDSALWEAVKVE